MKLINREEIDKYIDFYEIYEATKNGFIKFSKGQTITPPFTIFKIPENNGSVHLKYGYVIGEETFSLKYSGAFYENEKLGLEVVDKAKPDFELLTLKFNNKFQNPKFNNMKEKLDEYKDGLTIIRSAQCPYTEKNVNEIIKTAAEKYNIKANLIDIKNHEEAQNVPCAFGTFCIIYNGEVISYHPISNTRFENIMKEILA